MDYNITKIIDGLFIADCAFTFDAPFLMGNKITRILGWTAYPSHCAVQNESIKQRNMNKNIIEIKFPSFWELQQSFQFIDQSQEQFLCALIYSQTQFQAGLIAIMYLMRRFLWTWMTSHAFLQQKIDSFEFSQSSQNQLELYQEKLSQKVGQQLKTIDWNLNFLQKYHCQTSDEQLLINTVKNKLGKGAQKNSMNLKQKKVKRIQWFDEVRPTSASSSFKNLAKFSISKAGKSIESNNFFIQQENIIKQVDFYKHQNSKMALTSKYAINSMSALNEKKKQASQRREEKVLEEDSQYLQLKELSRTNFNDRRFSSSKVKSRYSLKNQKTEAQIQQKNNINTIVGIYGNNMNFSQSLRPASAKKQSWLSKSNSTQLFLNSLKNFNKISSTNA